MKVPLINAKTAAVGLRVVPERFEQLITEGLLRPVSGPNGTGFRVDEVAAAAHVLDERRRAGLVHYRAVEGHYDDIAAH